MEMEGTEHPKLSIAEGSSKVQLLMAPMVETSATESHLLGTPPAMLHCCCLPPCPLGCRHHSVSKAQSLRGSIPPWEGPGLLQSLHCRGALLVPGQLHGRTLLLP